MRSRISAGGLFRSAVARSLEYCAAKAEKDAALAGLELKGDEATGAAVLRRAGFRDSLIQFGGDMFAGGLRDGHPWNLGIRDPRGPETRIFASVALSDATFSTSGDYERFFMANGRRYHHIIDPTTGEYTQGQFESWTRFEVFDPALRK